MIDITKATPTEQKRKIKSVQTRSKSWLLWWPKRELSLSSGQNESYLAIPFLLPNPIHSKKVQPHLLTLFDCYKLVILNLSI